MHTNSTVYLEMFLTICARYASLPDPRTLTLEEIELFYDGLRYELISESKKDNA